MASHFQDIFEHISRVLLRSLLRSKPSTPATIILKSNNLLMRRLIYRDNFCTRVNNVINNDTIILIAKRPYKSATHTVLNYLLNFSASKMFTMRSCYLKQGIINVHIVFTEVDIENLLTFFFHRKTKIPLRIKTTNTSKFRRQCRY